MYSNAYRAGENNNIESFYNLSYVIDNYDWAGIILETKDPTDSGETQIHANYTHVYSTGRISIGLGFEAVSVRYTEVSFSRLKRDIQNF